MIARRGIPARDLLCFAIGNYLAGLGIPATAGFGVDYVSLHATDERCRIDTIPTVHAVYQHALLTLLAGEH
ncbi:hypothetical protein CFP71_27905 [Amycolatopsis thailandensis]|uniref:Peptidase M20 dimerisation domain-containing protein n=1 Tax=Amycolatopsis thailandensis TaxID=589330 RepID=A0A229RUU0_9PSEU|nr:hypothetical protein [Amycolatopsis thailandensis]OXM50261.1 hypothetical protein CFP71_27905 [Amycolatopsis thailandensis]